MGRRVLGSVHSASGSLIVFVRVEPSGGYAGSGVRGSAESLKANVGESRRNCETEQVSRSRQRVDLTARRKCIVDGWDVMC